MIEWWFGAAQDSTDVKCLTEKTASLMRRLLAAAGDATQTGVKLTLEQQRAFVMLCEEALRSPGLFSAVQAPLLAGTWWPRAKGLALAWGMIPVSNQARATKAWVDFYSVPGGSD